MGIYFATDIDRINNEYMPRLNLEIGRYINYSKLESMLSTQTLFFCNASRFDDEYEGEIPLEFFDGWAQQSEENEIRSIIYKNSQEAGLQIPFNFKGFVSRVVLNPKSNDQQKEAIIELLNRYSYTTIVEE